MGSEVVRISCQSLPEAFCQYRPGSSPHHCALGASVYCTVTVQSKKQYPTISDEKYENRSIRDVPTTKHSFDKLYIIHALN